MGLRGTLGLGRREDEQLEEYEPEGAGKARRWLKLALRVGKILLILLVVLAAAVGLLFVITPSAGQASQLVRQEAADHRIQYPGPPVPKYFSQALVATEDHRFYTNPGVDPLALARVVAAKITGKQDQGGSTITQQLAKMLYTPGQIGFATELEQVTLAMKLNMTYSKAQILQMYSEVAYYGHGYYGLEQSSCGYFGRQPQDLTLVQAAMLAGAVNAPTFDDPLVYPAQARARLVHVLSRMQAVGYLTKQQETQALAAPLDLSATRGCA
ncbi:MAG TPA: biosynthetic peptidoglycan transglycosylase [Streptosporangiaceae bacterium]